ncbi:MAG: YheV family putative metal-binding protein [Moraxella sp.]|nr:YheV family putative metal-binding protein [Moraxella sp.]
MRYQSNRPKRQFLAGVACRACKAIDTTVQVQTFEPVDEYIECVACHHQERRPSKDEASAMRAGDGFGDTGVIKFIP